jgi:hypothetical protein
MALQCHVLKKGALLVRHLYTKNINNIFSRVIHGTTSAHSVDNFVFVTILPNATRVIVTPIWDPYLGPPFRTPILDPHYGPPLWTPIMNPILDPHFRPPFWTPIIDPNFEPPFWTPILDPHYIMEPSPILNHVPCKMFSSKMLMTQHKINSWWR